MDESPKRRKQRAETHGYLLYEFGLLYNGDSDLSGAQAPGECRASVTSGR
jgi:hypothetical protein